MERRFDLYNVISVLARSPLDRASARPEPTTDAAVPGDASGGLLDANITVGGRF